jgi:hypothetical protein
MNSFLVFGFAMVGVGLLLCVFAKPFAAFQRNTVSRVLPRRYWIAASDPMAVRLFGIVGAVLGLVAVGVNLVWKGL